jgi:hypothetical protein
MGQADGLQPVPTDFYIGDDTWSRASARGSFHTPVVGMRRGEAAVGASKKTWNRSARPIVIITDHNRRDAS